MCSLGAEAFDVDFLRTLMAKDYQLYCLEVHSEDCGHAGVGRARRYVILRHLATTEALHCPHELYAKIANYISSRIHTRPSDYMLASNEEILLEAQDVAQQRNIVFEPYSTDLHYLLNQRERSVLEAACAMYQERTGRSAESDPNFCVFLGDNPGWSLTTSITSLRIPTFRLNAGKTFFPFHRRWMVSSERLATFGFPVRKEVARSMGLPAVAIRDLRRASLLAGNCMLLPAVAIVQLVALCCIALKQTTGSVY